MKYPMFMLLLELVLLTALLALGFRAVFQPGSMITADIVKSIILAVFFLAMQFDTNKKV